MKPGGTLSLLRVGEMDIGEIEDRRLAVCDAIIMCGGRAGSLMTSVLEGPAERDFIR